MIELQNVSKQYTVAKHTVTALKNINLSVKKGEIFGVIGASGAGKSTLIRCVNLLERPTTGKTFVDKQELTALDTNQLRHARRKIGMIFQHFNLLSSRTVYENIALPLELDGIKKKEIHATISPLLELTGLGDKKDNYLNQLSGGQKQRVAIARALVNRPHVLLSDEATSALDPETTHSILQLLKSINEKLGVTILLITHEMEVVKEVCHRLAIIDSGEIVEQSEVINFFSCPKTALARKLINQVMKHHLPEAIKKRLVTEKNERANHLIRVSFIGKAAQEPIVAHLARTFNLEINILQANIEQIRDETVGVMVIEVNGEFQKLQQGIHYFTEKGVHFEVIGYVEPNH